MIQDKNEVNLEKDEYEMTLYGFTISDFKRENVLFFRDQVKRSVDFMAKKFGEIIKDEELKGEFAEKIKQATCSIEKKIFEQLEQKIHTVVNKEVEDCLRIPDNVVLPCDRMQLNPEYKNEDLDVLEAQNEELLKLIKKNSCFIKALEEELISYNINDLIENENNMIIEVEKLLNDDSCDINVLLEEYLKLEECCEEVDTD